MLETSVRTVMVTMSPLLGDIIKQLTAGKFVLDIVAHLDSRISLGRKLRKIAPDLVLLGLRSHETDRIGRTLLTLIPTARVIAFSSDARLAYLHEMRPHRVAIMDVSARALAEVIGRSWTKTQG